ncbi:hypothetical protein [Aliterella atlantica]|uniref:DUF2281 domain-containing protein n=1 Tax=Aliterella atlantica CENA595 TaxID=1618023 RepID=A0A0D8ZVE4_9CYAN|nr:hypothetical protein [Aliterella atlantica]KJH71191.1 hypothetical protein UH38_14395 [Aliterella atlantica CENA595]
MDSLKQKIVEKLEHLPVTALQEVLNYVDFLEWRKTDRKRSLTFAVDNLEKEREEAWREIGENCPIEYVGGVLVVKAQGAKNLETAVQELREERSEEITSW